VGDMSAGSSARGAANASAFRPAAKCLRTNILVYKDKNTKKVLVE
jgi:hypothetical protein